MDRNPFTPGFGLTPPVLAMQGTPVEDFAEALEGTRPAGHRSVLISGARGVGKTVLLSQFHDVAEEVGWEVIALHTSSDSLADELRGRAVHALRDLDPEARDSRVTSGSISALGAGASLGREISDRYEGEDVPLAVLLDRLAALASLRGGGLLVLLDEVQSADPDQVHVITQHMQDLAQRGHAAGFVAAGVRAGVDELLANPKTTFLRRAHQVEIGSVDVGIAAQVIMTTVADTDNHITPEAAVRAGEISQGYPYLIQVVGAEAWQRSGTSGTIEIEDVEGAREFAIDAMVHNVHGPALRDINGRKDEYLLAMLEDDGPSAVMDVARRMGIDQNNQNVYRSRLIADEMIRPAGRGHVELAMPYLREALIRRRDGGRSALAHGPARVARPVRASRPVQGDRPASGSRPGRRSERGSGR
ncbi:ATP-binding protein [Brachybacterium muris]|uniref:ATP-binding protein n=1 Tax=Brachybacterium muris TaxID=219301 RepID=UPI00223BEE3F|nr:ATP-binding protein [Brachybacterium muris]MCT2177826.1 ATP-binding protein [Brachybacterium muris]